MYIMMCEIRKINDDSKELISAHPIDAVEKLNDAHDWMRREPKLIIEHLNNMEEDIWHIEDRNETHAVIVNKDHSIERTYVYREI